MTGEVEDRRWLFVVEMEPGGDSLLRALTPFPVQGAEVTRLDLQTDGGLARYREGLGLGLPIASRLLSEQRSTLTLQSKVGEGTIASVRFSKRADAAAGAA